MKTEQGRAEMQARSLVKDRARRNLLLMIDGARSQELLLKSLTGIGEEDFQALSRLDLIAPALGAVSVSPEAPGRGPETPARSKPSAPAEPEHGYAHFTATLTKLISEHLGLRGFTLTLAVEKAQTGEELQEVGRRVVEMLRKHKGDQVAAEATKLLYGR